MKAMVVGAGGFVGNYLIDAIHRDLACEIVATKMAQESFFREDVEVVNLDVLNPGEIEQCLAQVDPEYVFYLAAQSSISRSWKNPVLTVEVNVQGSLNFLNGMRSMRKPPRALMVGSGEEYGLLAPDKMPISEEEMLNPQNIYAATKTCQNMMSTVYHSAYGLPLIMVRAFNHMGPGQSEIFVVSDFCHQAVRIEMGLQEPVIQVGNLKAKRDFTDVRDVVRAYTSLIQFGRPGETYNVGSGRAVSIQSILDTVVARSKSDIEIQVDPRKLRPIEAPVIEADITKLYETTGWQPEISLESTIDGMLDYWRNKLREENNL